MILLWSIIHLPDHISPLGLGIFRNMVTHSSEARRKSQYSFFLVSAGRIYADASAVLQSKKTRNALIRALSNMDFMSAEALSELVNRPDFGRRIKKSKSSMRTAAKIAVPALAKIIYILLFKDTKGTVDYMNNFIDQYEKKVEDAIRNEKQGIKRLDAINEHGAFIHYFLREIIPNLVPGLVSLKLLQSFKGAGNRSAIYSII